MEKMNKEFKSAVGAVICDCETYIQEWCCFQYLTGFDKIIICLDRCTDNTRKRIDGLPPEVQQRIDVFDNSPHDPGEGFQYRGYRHIYERYHDRVEWLAMFDDDEYLYDSQMRKINEMLDGILNDVSQIVIPWLNFTHSGKILSATPDITRLRHCMKREFRNPVECKVVVRIDNIIYNEISSNWYHCHYVDVSGREVTFDGKDSTRIANLPTLMMAESFNTCLAHYVHGSMEDWVKKYKKWKLAQDDIGSPVEWGNYKYRRFDSNHMEDTRMEQYADELIALLKECK